MSDKTEMDRAFDEYEKLHVKVRNALAEACSDCTLPDALVLSTIQSVYAEMLAVINNDDERLRKLWMDHVEEFERRHFTS